MTLKAMMQNSAEADRVHILIVDSVASLVSPTLGGGPGYRGHSLMIQLAAGLKQLAAAFDIAVLVTNHTVTGECSNARACSMPFLVHHNAGSGLSRQPSFGVLHCKADPASVLLYHVLRRGLEECPALPLCIWINCYIYVR